MLVEFTRSLAGPSKLLFDIWTLVRSGERFLVLLLYLALKGIKATNALVGESC